QVEPHFLYTTLANVVSLIDTEPATAKAMIERLIALLRSAAAAAGTANATLASQVEHLRAYLELIALRMGGRLAFRVDVPPALAGVAVPPLLLQPLVENAIRHGLEPKVGGGSVAVAARRIGEMLELTVVDDGVGFAAKKATPAKGSGLGLANLRARLASIYGGAASIVIEDNAPSGSRITLRLPLSESE
ncbi:MAG: histidine kinase, partial [Casimicrobiaceae bacterium]